MRQREFQKLLKKYKKGLCSPEEEEIVERWFRAMASSEGPSLHAFEKPEVKERSWIRVREHAMRSKMANARAMRSTGSLTGTISVRAWAVAAAVSMLVVSVVFLVVRPGVVDQQRSALKAAAKNIFNDTEEVMDVLLKDGTRVLLKPKSGIHFSEPFDNTQRLVSLEGEAFFEVSRDTLRPFLVNTGEVITKVLGTSFTVSAFPHDDNITVSVVTGKVSVVTNKDGDVTTGTPEETILTPNQKIVYNKNKQVVSRAIINEPVPILPAEVVRRMRFEAAPIREIFEGLEQVYGVDIDFDANVFRSCVLTTSIADGNIYNRLDMICKAIDARYAVKEDRIVITGDGCGQ